MFKIPAALIKPFGFLGIPALEVHQDNPPVAPPVWDYIDIALVSDPTDDIFHIVRDPAQRDDP